MKKKISLLTIALLAIGLTACGNSTGQAAGRCKDDKRPVRINILKNHLAKVRSPIV